MATSTRLTKNAFLWSVASIYLFAFTSLYTQIPGLYGNNGVLPLKSFAQIDQRGIPGLETAMLAKPSLVWLAPRLGITLATMMELICLIGTVLSALCLLTANFRNAPTYLVLYILYYSLYQVGQVFLSFQWDILLLEVGFLTVLVAPFVNRIMERPHDRITLWLVRWLLFRFMFAAGVVKLTSQCSTWWGLTSLNYHFESQCLPTPLSWYAHHLPQWFLKLGVVGTFVIEIAAPFLVFVPIAQVKLVAFWLQVIFQVSIMFTGNYNFFNFLTIALCIPLLNDEQLDQLNLLKRLSGKSGDNCKLCIKRELRAKFTSPTVEALRSTVAYSIYLSLIYWTVRIFSIGLASDGTIKSEVNFQMSDFDRFLANILPISIAIGVISLGSCIISALFRSITEPNGLPTKVIILGKTLVCGAIAIWVFSLSLVPHTEHNMAVQKSIWPVVHKWHRNVYDYHISNSYGLFRRMTGVGGRQELVLEGSNDLKTGWKEYHFSYKPGDISKSPQWLMPHQPRLDWQMWFAALGSYQGNTWIMSLAYRLMTGQPEVLALLEKDRIPFKQPPKYIRGQLYIYKYTTWGSAHWWTRTVDSEWLPPVTATSLGPYLKSMDINVEKKFQMKVTNHRLQGALTWVRKYVHKISPTAFIYAVFGTVLAIVSIG